MTAMPTSRQRGTRRESTSSAATSGPARVRKSSIANGAAGGSGGTGAGSMRPRANTISHVDNATLGMIAAANSSVARQDGLPLGFGHHPGMSSLPGVGGYHFRGMSTATGHHGNPHVLPKLDTNGLNNDVSASLRTAPPYGGFGGEIDMENLWYGPGSTVNPAQLHFSNSPQSLAFDTPASPYQQGFQGIPPAQATMNEQGNFAWLHGFDNQLSFNHTNEQAIDLSSPSAHSTGSHSGLSEVMLDGPNNPVHTSSMWQNPMMSQVPLAPEYSMDLSGTPFPDLLPTGQMSPKSLHDPMANADRYFSTPSPLTSQTPLSMMHGLNNQYFHPPMAANSETPSNSAASISSSNRQSSVTSVSTDSITDATRQALVSSLSHPSLYGHNHLKTSQPQTSSPLSTAFAARSRSMSGVHLPSTYDLQRYVAAYIQYFHPHLPFLHVPSLSFDSPAYTNSLRASSGQINFSQSGIVGGGGSLILAMAAIGALYEYELNASKDLFEMAKKMIQLYLEERRKTDMSAALNGSTNASESSAQNTPLWLVQAMLLNVIYGHNCGDRTAAGIASTHCAALVSLARAAELAKPLPHGYPSRSGSSQRPQHPSGAEDIQMGGDEYHTGSWNVSGQYNLSGSQNEWYDWKLAEERKRTLYAVFILSSLLVSAYNHAPALMNSEIRLDLPCDEDLWAADCAEAWYALGGATVAEQKALPFASALSSLLTASQRRQQQQLQVFSQYNQPFGSTLKLEDLPESEIRPSTFGCLVLINALHNYIWETRQRHMGRQWTTQETEAMHAHVEPALRAWQAAWASNPQHSFERPNPFGISSLSADCIPLLDLAYVRLFVNLGRSKEAFWQRDFDGMADELAQGSEIVQHADHSPDTSPSDGGSTAASASTNSSSPMLETPCIKAEQPVPTMPVHHEQLAPQSSGQCSKRERHLRKAAFCAATSLSMADKLGVTFADFNSRELPLQSAMCAFDCAQVLAEWVSTVQQRVGRYLGIIGKDEIDFGQVPGIMLLDDEDCKLLRQIEEVLGSAEVKLGDSGNMSATAALTATTGTPNIDDCGYGSKILMVTARMLENAAVWPGKCTLHNYFTFVC